MSDLFDDARPVRDATLVELERVLAGDDSVPHFVKDGCRLGTQMTALMMAYTAKKLNGTSGEIANEGLQDYLAIAISHVINYAVTGFRPVRNGKALSPLETFEGFLGLLIAHAVKQVQMSQAGLQDFTIPFRYRDGVLTPEKFDLMDMLNKVPRE